MPTPSPVEPQLLAGADELDRHARALAAAISAEHSVRDLRATLANATPAANGTFLNHDGDPIPW